MRLLRTRRHAPPYRALFGAALASALMCGTALAGQPPGIPANGPFAPHVSGNATSDSITTTTNGGVQSNAGDWSTQAGAAHFYGPDGSEVLRVSLGGSSVVDIVDVVGGVTGVGPSIQSYSVIDASVPLSLLAQGVGPLNFGTGSGISLQVVDPAGAVTQPLTVAGGVGGSPLIGNPLGGIGLTVASGNQVVITQAGQVVARFGTTGTVGTSTSWIDLQPGATGSNYGRLLCTGTDPSNSTSCFFQARGTGTFTMANSSGTMLVVATSSANTTTDYATFRAASTTVPVLLQTSGVANVAAGGVPGTHAALATTATTGHFGIPVIVGKLTATPAGAGAGVAFIYYDSADNELCAFNMTNKCTAAMQ
jgi:hypothetical protein